MAKSVKVRLTPMLADWLHEMCRTTGVSIDRVVLQQLERAMASAGPRFMRHAGKIEGAAELSTRRGFTHS